MKSNRGIKAQKELQEKIQNKEVFFKKEKEALDAKSEKWKAQAAILSEEARMKEQQSFYQEFAKLQEKQQAFQMEIRNEERKVTQEIARDVVTEGGKLAKEKNLDLVFESNSAGLIYAKNPIDLTDEIIQKENKLQSLDGKKLSKK